MKKRYLLPVFMVAGLVSLAGAKDCLVNGDKAYCMWDACYAIDPLYAEDPATATCQSEVDNCASYGELYTSSSCSGTKITGSYTVTESGLSDEQCTGYYCNWSECGIITTDKNGTHGSVISTCTDAIANCATNSPSSKVYSNATCTTLHPDVEQGEDCGAYCMWDACYKITPDDCSSPDSDPACSPTTTCAEAIQNCVAYSPSGTAYSNNTCTSSSPILTGTSPVGLTVLVSNGSLHVSSLKDATVSLFNMQGKQIFSAKVASGYNVLSLKEQKMGVYYAIVQSGSAKQTVKVLLK